MTVRSSKNQRKFQRLFEEGLMDNISLTESLGERIEACGEHGEFTASGIRYLYTKIIWSKCPCCESASLKEKSQAAVLEQAERARVHLEALLGQSAIPRRFLNRSFDNFVVESPEQNRALYAARDFADNFAHHAERGDGLVFCGLPGTGKSHLATSILQSILPSHKGLYITCSGMISAVRATWSRRDGERTEVQVMRDLCTVPLLVIDEVGVSGGTDNELALIFDVLDRRYREMRPTILLTNLDVTGLKAFVGDRVFDRLTETVRWIPFTWGSYRPAARKQFAPEHAHHVGTPSNEPQFTLKATGA